MIDGVFLIPALYSVHSNIFLNKFLTPKNITFFSPTNMVGFFLC